MSAQPNIAMEASQLSEEEFRHKVWTQINQSNVKNSLQAQLRDYLIKQLHVCDEVCSEQAPDLRTRVLNTLVNDFLKSSGYSYSLSIFSAESGTNEQSRVPHRDILEFLGLGKTCYDCVFAELNRVLLRSSALQCFLSLLRHFLRHPVCCFVARSSSETLQRNSLLCECCRFLAY